MSAEETTTRCAALTHAGAPCKNYPLPGSRYCRAHQPMKNDRPSRRLSLPRMVQRAKLRPRLPQKTPHLKHRCGSS